MRRVLSIVGAGRLGTTLGKSLRERGWRIGAVVTRSAATSRAAVRAIGGGTPRAGLTREALVADVIFLAVPDDALAGVARTLARIGGKECRGLVFLHASGALDRKVLAALARLGASTGSLHPMQTFSGRGLQKHAPKLEGVIFAVEGDAKAVRAGRGIAVALGGVPVMIDARSKPAYHAAGVLVAGHALALVEAAARMLIKTGFTRPQAVKTLLPLMRQMLDNFSRLGPQASWTGPVARGDYATVGKHVNALRRHPREFRRAYAALALLGERVLSKKPAARLRQLKRALKNPSGGFR